MGLYDREYTQADFHSQRHYGPQMRLNFPRLTPVVKWLIIINFSVHLLKVVFFPVEPGTMISRLDEYFSVFPISVPKALQIWRLVTYQFLHAHAWHIFVNMLGLFFLGPTLERHWGSKKFLIFYLCCGIAGGVFFTLLCAINPPWALPMVGASGSILGMLAACAILFPHFIVLILFFPVPIRVAAIALTGLYILNILAWGDNAGGDVAHLAGMAAGAAYVLSGPWRSRLNIRKTAGQRWEKKMTKKRNLQIELDRILDKVHKSGIHSLTSKEKRTLKKATKAEQMRNSF
jgi:membrane associated rhomboid family serine protease